MLVFQGVYAFFFVDDLTYKYIHISYNDERLLRNQSIRRKKQPEQFSQLPCGQFFRCTGSVECEHIGRPKGEQRRIPATPAMFCYVMRETSQKEQTLVVMIFVGYPAFLFFLEEAF